MILQMKIKTKFRKIGPCTFKKTYCRIFIFNKIRFVFLMTDKAVALQFVTKNGNALYKTV